MKQENEYNPDVEHNYFANMVKYAKGSNFFKAAQIYNEAGFCAIDIIHKNESAKEFPRKYYNFEQEIQDTIPYLDNLNHLTLIVEMANNIKKETR